MNLLSKSVLLSGALVASVLLSGCGKTDRVALQKEKQQKVIQQYTDAADRGELFAISQIGAMYWHGQGVSKDYKKAVDYFKKGAEKGDALSLYNLGVAYNLGKGIAPNKLKAYETWVKAVNAGSENAAYNLDILCKDSAWACKTYSQK